MPRLATAVPDGHRNAAEARRVRHGIACARPRGERVIRVSAWHRRNAIIVHSATMLFDARRQ